jgi:hypothetical protein
LNHEYACQRRPDQQQLQETLAASHFSHLLSLYANLVSLLLLKRPPQSDGYDLRDGLAISSPALCGSEANP